MTQTSSGLAGPGAAVSASGVAPGQELGELPETLCLWSRGTVWSSGIPELPRNGEFARHYFYGLDYCKVNRGWLNSEGFHSQCQGFISLFKALTNTLYNESNPCHFWNFMTVRTLHNFVFLPLLLYKAYGAPLKCISFLQLLEAHLSSLHWLSCCLWGICLFKIFSPSLTQTVQSQILLKIKIKYNSEKYA